MRPKLSKTSCDFIPKGESVERFTPGDFILVSDNSKFSNLIRFGQSLRFQQKFAKWNHCAIIANPNGEVIEADGNKVVISPLSKYSNKEYYIVRIDATIEDRHEAVNFAIACLDDKYGWVTIASIALSLLSGLHFSFGFDGQEICSGLVARSLERTAAIFKRDASHITPADLAYYYLRDKI